FAMQLPPDPADAIEAEILPRKLDWLVTCGLGRLGPVIDTVHVRALSLFGHELLHGLEEVDVQAGEAIDAGELGIGGLGGEAIIADELADDGAVLLFDMGAVVLLPGAAASEGDAALAAVVVQALVDELAPVVAV